MLDVTDSVRTERELHEAQTKYGALVEQIPAIVYVDVVDERMSTSYVSPQIEALLGITPEEYIDDPDMWVHAPASGGPGRDARRVPRGASRRRAVHAGVPPHRARRARRCGSATAPSWSTTTAGQPLFVQGVMLDITQRKVAEEEIAFLAYHDKLTGLPNRAMFDELLELSLARARRHGLGVSVISLDIDNFKLVNDSLGHEAGNELITLLLRAPARGDPRGRPDRAPRSRRVPDAPGRPGPDVGGRRRRSRDVRGRVRRGEDPRRVAGAVRGRGHRALRHGVARDQRLPEPRRDRRDDPEARRQRDGPQQADRPRRLVHARGRAPPTRWASCRSAPGCGRPSRTRAGCSTTSR